MRRKVVYIVSDINKALAFEWIAQSQIKDKFHLIYILLNPGDSVLEDFLRQQKIEVYRVGQNGVKDWPLATLKTYQLLKNIKPDIIHCHLLAANVIGLVAGKLAGVTTRIYTRHHSSLHHIYFPKGIWWDKLSNRLATHIVAISSIVKDILIKWEKANESKVILIPHGFLLEGFSTVNDGRIADFKRRHYIEGKAPVIGVISRFTEWKGIQYIIPAFQRVLEIYPNSVLLLLNAQGDYENELLLQLNVVPESAYRLIKFESDIAAAYKSMDVFVHTPIDEHSEAFGQIYVESLAAGIPSVFSRSGIANESYFNQNVAVMVDYKNSEQIYSGIREALQNELVTNQRIVNGKAIAEKFNYTSFTERLVDLYSHS